MFNLKNKTTSTVQTVMRKCIPETFKPLELAYLSPKKGPKKHLDLDMKPSKVILDAVS